MIEITHRLCCGCSACVQTCPKKCISFHEDEEGFLYPEADNSICIDCGLCESVCPVINQKDSRQPKETYAAVNPDIAVRKHSSSGGVFSMLAEKVIDERGVVFGVSYNDQWEVVHAYTETIDGLSMFQGSKYVQSRISNTYSQAELFLKQGRKVLFSGTSCQIAGLNLFLHKTYTNLITVDIVCHGVPSPKLWREYLSDMFPKGNICHVSMKDKSQSWRAYHITVVGEEHTFTERASQNKYMLAFSQNLSLRPSCYQCPAKAGKSESDITLADFWGVEKLVPELDDDRGTSLVCANTDKGLRLIQSLPMKLKVVDYEVSAHYNPCIEQSVQEPFSRVLFWQSYQKNGIKALDALKPKKANLFIRLLRRALNK